LDYSGLTVNLGKVLNYLGRVFDFKTQGMRKITMDGFAEDLLCTCHEIKGTASMPAGAELFSVDEASPTRTALKRQEFHSLGEVTLPRKRAPGQTY
jgi:hypothetical protein